MAFKKDLFSKDSSRLSFLDRVRNVGQSLRSVKPVDVAFFAANVAVGAAAKILVVGSLAAVGVTASTVLGGAVVALAGGAAVGATRVVISHAFGRSKGPLFSRGYGRRKVLLGGAISGATFGVLVASDWICQTEMGQEFIGRAKDWVQNNSVVRSVADSSVGEKLSSIFTKAADGVRGWFSKPASEPVSQPVSIVANEAQAGTVVPEHCEILKKANGSIIGYQVDVGPGQPGFEKINLECQAKWGEAVRAERGLDKVSEVASATKGTAPIQTALEEKPLGGAPQGEKTLGGKPQVARKSGGLKGMIKALAGVPKADVIVPQAVPSVPVSVPANDLASEELKKVLVVTSQTEMNETYAAERMRATLETLTGAAPAEEMSVQEMAAQIHPENPEMYLKGIQQQAPQLDKAHLAAACKTAIPREFGQGDLTVTTDCTELKEVMGAQDVVTVRDVNSDTPKKGIRALWRGLARVAVGAKTDNVTTLEFISKHVGGQGGVVEEMTEAAKADFLAQPQQAQMVPQ